MIPIYSPKKNSIHLLPTGAKMIYMGCGLAAVMLINHPLLLFAGLLAAAAVFVRAEEMKSWIWYLKIFSVMGTFYFVLSAIFSKQGNHALFTNQVTHALFRWVTAEEVVFGISFVLKLMLTLSIFVFFSLTVHPDRLLAALGRRAMRSALALSISVRLFPTLMKDAKDIYDAHISRGLPLDRGSVVKRWMKRIPLIIPLLSNALERTSTLAESMESRGFGRSSSHKKAMNDPGLHGRFRRVPTSALSLSITAVSGIVMLTVLTRIGGWGLDSSYTVELGLGVKDMILGLLLFMVVAAPLFSPVIKEGRG